MHFLKKARSTLSKRQVIGAFCGSSKHSGLMAAESGANYISFTADYQIVQSRVDYVELFKWWTEFIEIPVMGECSKNCLISNNLWNYCDYFSLRDIIWYSENSIETFLKPT